MTTINVSPKNTETARLIKWLALLAGVILLIVIFFAACTFTVGEGQQAAISRFGVIYKIIINPQNDFLDRNPDLINNAGNAMTNVQIVHGKGLFFKVPFMDQVQLYDSRLFTYVSGSEPVNTADKKQYYITMFAQWRVANPGLFQISHREYAKASNYLDNLIYPLIIQDVNKMQADDFLSNKDVLNENLQTALASINETVRSTGIEVVDMQVHRTTLPPANLQSTYDRMIANRQKVAQQLRSEGDEAYSNAVATADLEASKIRAAAITQSQQIKGEADAEAMEIYAQGYSADADFYSFWRSLQALKNSVAHDATIVLDNNNPLWKDLWDMVTTGEVKAQ